VRPGSASSSGDVDVCIHKTVRVEHTGVYRAYFMAIGVQVQELNAAKWEKLGSTGRHNNSTRHG
jgi:hypothetical protein